MITRDAHKTRVLAVLLVIMSSLARISPAQGPDAVSGYAAVDAEGVTTTTGGGDAVPVTVSSFLELSNAVTGATPRVIVVAGTILTTDGGGFALRVGSNKTIRGIDKNATIYGGVEMNGVNNVIISDINFHGIYPNSGPDDALAVRNSHHIWFNHLNVWDAGDGNLDITNQSSYVTVSWCKFWYTDPGHGHRLCCLIGSGGGDHPEDWDKLKVTFHHNWFADLVDSRMPRLMYGQAHAYNNYYTSSGNDYCIGVGSYGSILVENNYFKNVRDPHTFMYDVWCHMVARGNVYDNTTGARDSGLGGSRDVAGQESFDVQPLNTVPYTYALDLGADVPALLTDADSGAGPRTFAATDTEPPTPNPMTWSAAPHAVGSAISMTATSAVDESGAEYYFANLTIPGHDSGWQTSPAYVDTGLGLHRTAVYTVTARDLSANDNQTTASVPLAATTASTAPVDMVVNYQIEGADIPAGCLPDYGTTFGDRGNGQVYGWNLDHTANARDRGVLADQQRDTIIHMKVGGVWECAAADGDYLVEVTVGDPAFASTYTINVEGVNYWNALALGAEGFATLAKTVSVSDGRISIDQGAGVDKATRICLVSIKSLSPPPTSAVANWMVFE